MLWSLGELAYLVVECKSGGTTEGIWRHDAEQLSHSMDWFDEKYDHVQRDSSPDPQHQRAAQASLGVAGRE